jgi:hypothetical protein
MIQSEIIADTGGEDKGLLRYANKRRLKRVRSRELFPLPVRPQRPILEPAGMEMEMLSSVILSLLSL